MIEPTKDDIGRRVRYHRFDGDTEGGVITSFNDHYVFVRYDKTISFSGVATKRDKLSWEQERPEDAHLDTPWVDPSKVKIEREDS